MPGIKELLKKRIFLLDGGMGTVLQSLNLSAKDFGGEQYEGCNEAINLSAPDKILHVHEAYLEAGADIIETNSFAGSSVTLSEYGLQERDTEINRKAAELAKAAAQKFSTPDKLRFVAGAIGPTNKTISVSKNVTFDELKGSYKRQAQALIEGGVDILLVETCFDTLNAKAALLAIRSILAERKKKLPIMISFTIEQNGRMLAGQDIEAAYVSVEHLDLLSVGMNCATGPDLMTDQLRTLSGICRTGVHCYPNAGIPLEDGTFPLGPEDFARRLQPFVDSGWLNIVGGCCGTTPEHIRELAKIIAGKKPRNIAAPLRSVVSGMDALAIDDDNRPIIVGERTNVIGSRKFKELIAGGEYDIACEVGVAQVKKGAHVIDVCLANPDRSELADTERFFHLITSKVRVPFMVDSTDPMVIEAALKKIQGKCIINSINFEDGEERIDKVMPLVREFGAAVVFGTIDEDRKEAMALTAKKKVAIAKRAASYLKEKWGHESYDIIFDPLVFPISTGEAQYRDSARETIEAIRRIKQEIPGAKTILGVSNVSFGLPASGREVLNSVYLYHATKAGLDLAIVNAEKVMRYPSIPDEEKALSEGLLLNKSPDALDRFVEHYRGKKAVTKHMAKLPLDDRLKTYIIEGTKDGLKEDLDEALKLRKPLDIINGPLMDGMEVVGKLFNENKLIVSEVLQSAEAMKAAVAQLEQHMDKSMSAKQGKVIIATVKGDVHDIGKNLFAIIMANNGFEVIDLGIKVIPEVLIEAIKEHKPDAVGLSGLLVKSAQMMADTAKDFAAAGITVPVLVGGAALTERFVATKIQPEYRGMVAYSRDAMKGLGLTRRIIMDASGFRKDLEERYATIEAGQVAEKKVAPSGLTHSDHIRDAPILTVPDLAPHIVDGDLREVFSYVNPAMLFGAHLGLRGNFARLIERGDEKAVKLKSQVEEIQEYVIKEKLITPKGIFQFFECNKDGNGIIIYKGKSDGVAERIHFERQAEGKHLCVADFAAMKERGRDTMGVFFTTCGSGIVERARALREKGEYLKSHLLQVLAIESAEGFAEVVHRKMRQMWGIDTDIPRQDIWRARYHGIRLSFGYPACRNLEDQAIIFRLVKPEQIGIYLTENFMMDPEASVSAIVFHHPQGEYFSV